jgi:hypothetical protein
LDHVPDFQQTTFAVFAPLTIPETQRLDALIREKFFPRRVAPDSFRQTMLKTVQLDGELRVGAVEIQNVIPDRVLAAKFAGDLFEAHGGRMLVAIKNSSPLTSILSPFGGARKKICKRAPPAPSARQTRNIPQNNSPSPRQNEEREKKF